MSDFTQWKPNERLQMIADALRGTTNFLNKARVPESVPAIGGIGLGDITTGTSGNLFERLAYGEPILNHNANESSFKDPQSIVDTGFLPGIGTLATALRKGGTKAVETGLNTGRRAALGNLGKGAALAGTAAASPMLLVDALKGGTKALEKEVAPTIAKIAPQQFPKELVVKLSTAWKKLADPEAFEQLAPHEILHNFTEWLPKHASKDKATEALGRFADMYATTPTTHTGRYTTQAHIDKLLEKSDDEIMEGVFKGTIKPRDYPPGTFDSVNVGDTAYGDSVNALLGTVK